MKEMGAPTGDGSHREAKRKGDKEQTLLGLSCWNGEGQSKDLLLDAD